MIQTVEVHWRKIALAAVVALTAPIYSPIIAPKMMQTGSMIGRKIQRWRGMNGRRTRPAKRLR
jgi:hypothetical protein